MINGKDMKSSAKEVLFCKNGLKDLEIILYIHMYWLDLNKDINELSNELIFKICDLLNHKWKQEHFFNF